MVTDFADRVKKWCSENKQEYEEPWNKTLSDEVINNLRKDIDGLTTVMHNIKKMKGDLAKQTTKLLEPLGQMFHNESNWTKGSISWSSVDVSFNGEEFKKFYIKYFANHVINLEV